MEDKRSTQLVLPLGLTYEPKHKDIIKQHWNVTFARQGRMSVAAKRIMARVIDQIRDDGFPMIINTSMELSNIGPKTQKFHITIMEESYGEN